MRALCIPSLNKNGCIGPAREHSGNNSTKGGSATTSPPTSRGNRGARSQSEIRGKEKVGQWTDQQMSAALAAVERGNKVRAAAHHFDIPQSTLANYVDGRIFKRKKGPPTILSHNEKNALEEYIVKMQDYEYPLTMEQVGLKVAEMMQERMTSFREGIPRNGSMK